MRLPFHIIQLMKDKSANDLRLPSDCEFLSLDIESKTGVRIGSTTLKRLLGFAQDERSPHSSTLDAIARYLGYAHWDELRDIEDKGNSDFETTEEEIRSDDLDPNRLVEFEYLPDRNFVLHHPLLVLNVWRHGESLGQFTAGRISGLSSITVL